MSDHNPRIYLLPNLMTAGNLFCGFSSVLRILEGALLQAAGNPATGVYHEAILFILGACVFDVLDGRVARLGGSESPFGREFDSLADIVSFGVAPALLVFQIVLGEFDHAGWMVAFAYLACGALRLARFNCIAAENPESSSKDFRGFPIPAAAGLTASLTLMMLWLEEGQHEIGPWKYTLPILLLFLSYMMFSGVTYPSFKSVNWRTKRSISRFLVIIFLVVFTVFNWQWMPAVIFISYLIYGFARPWVPKSVRSEVEDVEGEGEGEEKAEKLKS